jgi:hypothetical protein
MTDGNGDSPRTVPLHALFAADGAITNPEAPFDPRELIRGADVIMGVDVMSRRKFIVYGRAFLEAASQADAPPLAGIVFIELDEETETDDLARLLGLVASVKGKHEYLGIEERKKRRPS